MANCICCQVTTFVGPTNSQRLLVAGMGQLHLCQLQLSYNYIWFYQLQLQPITG